MHVKFNCMGMGMGMGMGVGVGIPWAFQPSKDQVRRTVI